MRKPRDYDSELKALDARARTLKTKHIRQLGELVIACHADALDVEVLAGALLAAASMSDTQTREGWRKAGAAFFRASGRSARQEAPQSRTRGASPNDGGAPPAARDASAQ
jgi:hypothetical protein